MSVQNLQERLEALKEINTEIDNLETELSWESPFGGQQEKELEIHNAAQDGLEDIKCELEALLKTELYDEEKNFATKLYAHVCELIN
jgi:hypothetical protein